MESAKLVAAVALAAFAAAMWYAFVRPVPDRPFNGIISQKLYKPAGTQLITPVGLNRGFRMPTTIPIAESFVLIIELDEGGGQVAAVVNTVEAKRYEAGQRVRVRLVERGLPFLWRRRLVTGVAPADSA